MGPVRPRHEAERRVRPRVHPEGRRHLSGPTAGAAAAAAAALWLLRVVRATEQLI